MLCLAYSVVGDYWPGCGATKHEAARGQDSAIEAWDFGGRQGNTLFQFWVHLRKAASLSNSAGWKDGRRLSRSSQREAIQR